MSYSVIAANEGMSGGLIYKFMIRAVNLKGSSADSVIVQYALAEVPDAPGQPTVLTAFTNDTRIAVQWTPPVSSASPGTDVQGYVLEMMNTKDSHGFYSVIYDGSYLFPHITDYMVTSGITAGQDYLFRVKAKYQNGYTPYSQPSAHVYACSPPNQMQAPTQVAVSSTQITLRWQLPQIQSSCHLQGFQIYMNDGQGSDLFTQIDQTQVNDKPYYFQHTTTMPSDSLAKTYLFYVRAYNVNGGVDSMSAPFVIGDLPKTPVSGPSSDLTVSTFS
jgi:hypothetical protein